MNLRRIAHLTVLPDPEGQGPAEPLSFEQLYQIHYSHVARISLRILGRRDEVEDCVQDTFLQAHRELSKLRHPAAVRAWLTTCAVRIARRKCRRHRLWRFLHLDDAPGYEEVAGENVSPADRLLLEQVYRALDTVPTEQRIAWTLRYIEGEPLEDVALLCECSLATAKRRIAAAQSRVEELCNHV